MRLRKDVSGALAKRLMRRYIALCVPRFHSEVAEDCVKPGQHVDHEQPLTERNLRVSEDRASLAVECAVAILPEIPLKLSVAAVSDLYDLAEGCYLRLPLRLLIYYTIV